MVGVWCSHDILSYRQVWKWSVLSRVVSMWGSVEVLLWSSNVLSWLQIGQYNTDITRQPALDAGPSQSRIFCKQNNHTLPWSWLLQLSARLQVGTR